MKNFPKLLPFLAIPFFVACTQDVAPDVAGGDRLPSTRWGSQGLIWATHRTNDIPKLNAAIEAGIQNYEVDIHVQTVGGNLTLMIGHEIATQTGQTFMDYMADLYYLNPDFNFLWLDLKDLSNPANEALIISELNTLDGMYGIKNRVLVESQYIQHLEALADDGWKVSFYSNWGALSGKTTTQQQAICQDWLNQMQTYNVDGISFQSDVYAPIRDFFAGKTVNGRPVQQYSWDLGMSYTTSDLANKMMQKWSHASVVLINYSGSSPLEKTVMDIEFAAGGAAANMGQAIQSGPGAAIQTQYNSTYEQYEAVFTGSNFLYVPYTQNDAIGRAIKGKFTMELLFSPEGGMNPLSSMESGGLGYELNNGQLEFWYHSGSGYVLPSGGSFRTPVQVGTNAYYHVFVTYDGSRFCMYVDGTKVKEYNYSGSFGFPRQNNASELRFGIGADYFDNAGTPFQNAFSGKIVRARIYNYALSGDQVTTITENAAPELVTDVEFAANGVATNNGTAINSLPATGSVNAIQTQFNGTYGKYEAIFDGTNFFYIPYTTSDAIGRAIKGAFSMELLFTPNGGLNPFASMESGGLGYELNGSQLEFWYNSGGSYVLPGGSFRTPVLLNANVYYHTFVTYDGGKFCMYVDGDKVGEFGFSGPFRFPSANGSGGFLMGIGGDYNPNMPIQNAFRGRIVQARVYKGALSETAVERITEETVL